jgi:Na+-translocating ferredoxin:NAD+ oxidoreductase RnfG subunit
MEINLADIEAKAREAVNNLTDEQIREIVLANKVRQKVATKKYYNAETAKLSRQRKAAELRAMTEILAKRGLLDEVNAQAAALADAQLAEEEIVDEQEPTGVGV